MTTYRVEGCLGCTVGSVDSIDEATALVLKQLPISAKTVRQLAGRLAKRQVGQFAHVDYGGTGCTVFVE
jgi:hypothetical protein